MKVIADGIEYELGELEATPSIAIVDYSRRETDDFGITHVVRRGFSRRMSVRLTVPFTAVDELQRSLASLRAKPARWVADDRFTWLDFVGFYKDFEIDLAVPPLSFCTLTIEGLAETEEAVDDGSDPAPDGGSTLRLLQPVTFGSEKLIASNVAEEDAPQWDAATTYPIGARVIRASTHRIYESAAANNVGNDPSVSADLWIDAGPTNRWAMFDETLGTVTGNLGTVSITIDAGGCDTIALLDVEGDTVRVQAASYDQTQDVGLSAHIFENLPPDVSEVTITVSSTGTALVGTLMVGNLVGLGTTAESPSAAITDFSRKEVDDFGNVDIVERAWAKKMSAKSLIRTDALDAVANRIASVRGRPALWIGDNGTDSLTLYGFFKDAGIEVGVNVSTLSVSVEGLSEATPIVPGIPEIRWPDIVDSDPDNRPRPDDGATVGAPNGTPVGDRTAEDVTQQLDAHDASIGTVQQDINNLEAVYGDTVSASAARTAAEAARDAANSARDDAQAIYDTITDAEGAVQTTLADLSQRSDDLESSTSSLAITVATQGTTTAARLDELSSALANDADALNPNPHYALWPDGDPLPTGWANNALEGSAFRERRAAPNGGWMLFESTNETPTANVGTHQDGVGELTGVKSGRFAVMIDVELVAGTFTGAGALYQVFNEAGDLLGAVPIYFPDIVGLGDGKIYNIRKIIDVPWPSAHRIKLHSMTNWVGFPQTAGKALNWHLHKLRPATPAEIAAETVLPGLQADVSSLQATTADLALNKASAIDLNSLGVTVDGLTSDIDQLDQALVDGLAQKASAVSVDGLASEIAAARDGQPSLNAKIEAIDQTIVDGLAGKASAVSVDSLGARVDGAETAITNIDSAVAGLAEASATRLEELEVAVMAGGDYLNANPNFALWKADEPLPEGWHSGALGGNATRQRALGVSGGWAVQESTGDASNNVILDQEDGGLVNISARKLVAEIAVTLLDGTFLGLGAYYTVYDAENVLLGAIPVYVWVEVGNGVLGNTSRVRKLIDIPWPSAHRIKLHSITNWAGFPAMAAKTVRWEHHGLVYATDAEIAANEAVPAMQASISTLQAVTSNLEETSARYEIVAAAGDGLPARISLVDKDGSFIALVADRIVLGNGEALVDVDGNLSQTLIRALKVSPRIEGTIFLPVQLEPIVKIGVHGDIIEYAEGGTFGANPARIVPDLTGIPAPAAGEVNDIQAINISPTQFQVRAIKYTPGGPVNQTSAAATDMGSAVTPRWQVDMPTAASASNGYYTFAFRVTLHRIRSVYEDSRGWNNGYRGLVELWRNDGSGFVSLPSFSFDEETWTTNQGPATITKDYSRTVQLGPVTQHAGKEFGASANILSVKYTTTTEGATTTLPHAIPFVIYPPAPV